VRLFLACDVSEEKQIGKSAFPEMARLLFWPVTPRPGREGTALERAAAAGVEEADRQDWRNLTVGEMLCSPGNI